MALTAAQKLSCYECLGVSYGPGAGDNVDKGVVHNRLGVINVFPDLDTLRDMVNAFIDNLSADVETRVAAIISEWDGLGYNQLRIENGNVGDAGGVSLDLDAKRDLLTKRLQIYIPVKTMAEQIEASKSSGNTNFIEFNR